MTGSSRNSSSLDPPRSGTRARSQQEQMDDLIDEIDVDREPLDPEWRKLHRDLVRVKCDFVTLSKELYDQARMQMLFEHLLVRIEEGADTVHDTAGGQCQMIWKIDKFRERIQVAATGKDPVVYSPSFLTHRYGYNVALSLCPYGDGDGKGTHLSLFFCVIKSDFDSLLPWPFQCRIRFSLLDLNADKEKRKAITKVLPVTPNKNNIRFLARPITQRNPSIGITKFIALDDVFDEAHQYVVDDNIFIRVEIDLTYVEPI